MLGERREQLKLGHGEGIAGIGDPGSAAQRAAQPGDPLGQPVSAAARLPVAGTATVTAGRRADLRAAGLAAARRARTRPRRGRRRRAPPWTA